MSGRGRGTLLRAFMAASLASVACVAQGHTSGASYSDWTLGPAGADVRARVSQLDLTRLQLHPGEADYAAAAGAAIAHGLRLRGDGEPCRPGPVRTTVGTDGWVRASWSVACDGAGTRAIEAMLFVNAAPGHLHFARVRMPSGERRERVLNAAAHGFALPDVATPAFARYVALGVEHIVLGWDHVAFVLALLLLAGSLGEMALLATGFTLAHSLTLAAAALGLVRTHTGPIEAVIGFSIALAAVEALWRRRGGRWMPATLLVLLGVAAWRLPPLLVAGLALFTLCYFALVQRTAAPARLRIMMTLLFGLVHGFGFASALQALALPPERLVAGLLGFNVGVEIGQLLVVGIAWPLLRAVTAGARAWTHDALASALCALGVYGFLIRVFA